eukprot:COSAG05_NODE_1573_length_4515_cov_33.607790_5_plen_133_part_00
MGRYASRIIECGRILRAATALGAAEEQLKRLERRTMLEGRADDAPPDPPHAAAEEKPEPKEETEQEKADRAKWEAKRAKDAAKVLRFLFPVLCPFPYKATRAHKHALANAFHPVWPGVSPVFHNARSSCTRG